MLVAFPSFSRKSTRSWTFQTCSGSSPRPGSDDRSPLTPVMMASSSSLDRVKFGPEELPPMPWFGMDIGGTLAKLVYFEPTDTNDEEEERVKNIRKYLTNNLAYGDAGHRDQQKQMEDLVIRNRKGRLHFIRFPTSVMRAFLDLAKEKGMADTISTVCATGGGAHKFENDIRSELNMSLHKVSFSEE